MVKSSNDRILRSLHLRAIAFWNYCNLAFLHPWERLSKPSRQRIARSRVHFAVTVKDLTDCPVTPRCYSDKLQRKRERKKIEREDFLESTPRAPDTLNAVVSPQNSIFAVEQRDFVLAPMNSPPPSRRRHNFCNIPEFDVRKRVFERKCYQANGQFLQISYATFAIHSAP